MALDRISGKYQCYLVKINKYFKLINKISDKQVLSVVDRVADLIFYLIQ